MILPDEQLPTLTLMQPECACRCVFVAPDAATIEPALLAAFGFALLAAGGVGFVAGRVKRIRARVKLTP